MSRLDSSLYMPYGAYELKATYQRNLLLGLAITSSFIFLLLIAGWTLSGARPVEVVAVQLDGPIEVIKEWREMPPIRRTGPDLGTIAPPENVLTGGRLNPLDDELFLDDEPVALATREELAVIVETGRGPGTTDGERYVMPVIEEELPGINDITIAQRLPELIHSVRPEYPRLAEQAGIEGRVILKALVSKEGDVLDAVVFASSGHVLLDEAALAVAGQYKYRPAIQNDRPIAIWVTYKVDFRLDL